MDAHSTAPAKRRLAELTGTEMRHAAARRPVILLPLGSHEDQGPHAPMGDYLSAEGVAQRIAATASEAGTETYVAPVLPFGGADFFASMPGGISLSQATLRAVLDECWPACCAMAWPASSSSTAMPAMCRRSTTRRRRSGSAAA